MVKQDALQLFSVCVFFVSDDSLTISTPCGIDLHVQYSVPMYMYICIYSCGMYFIIIIPPEHVILLWPLILGIEECFFDY